MRIEVGDKVRIKKHERRPGFWNFEEKMDKYMGKVVMVDEVKTNDFYAEGWVFSVNDVDEVVWKREEIVIYRKHNDVIAVDKRTGEKAVAICSPEDTFDFNIGAKLALERLTRGPLNCKIVFLESKFSFEKGRIYKIENGQIDQGDVKITPISKFYTIEDVKKYFEGLDFIEIKE